MTEIYLETTRKFYRKYSNYLYNRYFYFCLIVSLIGVLCLLTLKLKNGNGKGEKKDFTLPPYVVGLAYYELGGATVTVIVPSSIPENTALIITLYTAYRKGYHGHHGYIRIKGSGQSHITTLIWATYDGTLHFNSNVKTKRLNYVGFKEKSVNQVAMKEFGKSTDVILSSYRSPLEINIPFKKHRVTPTPSYIIGLAYYELGGKTVTIIAQSSIPQNTALIITLYEAYHPGFRQQEDANVNVGGAGRNNISTIIWSTYESALHFNANVTTKRFSYVGYKQTSVNQVANKEFGKDADVILSSYRSPRTINVYDYRPTKKPSYIVGLAYYEFRGRTVTVDIPSSIPQNTALIITSYEAYQALFGQRSDATIYIAGAGRSHVTTIIWSTYENSLNFITNAVTKQLNYAGYRKTSVNKVAQKEFGKEADIILSGYSSPLTIRIPPVKPLATPSYIIGLAYYELGGKTVTIIVQSSIPQNTALIITLYEAYHPGFRQQEDANINIEGAGRNNISTIIWSTYESALHFNGNVTTKRSIYAGYKKASVNQVANKEFGKDADAIISSYRSPRTINLH